MKKIVTHKELLEMIEEYLALKGIKPHVFGKEVLNDSGFVPRLREGSDPRLSTVVKIINTINGR